MQLRILCSDDSALHKIYWQGGKISRDLTCIHAGKVPGFVFVLSRFESGNGNRKKNSPRITRITQINKSLKHSTLKSFPAGRI